MVICGVLQGGLEGKVPLKKKSLRVGITKELTLQGVLSVRADCSTYR